MNLVVYSQYLIHQTASLLSSTDVSESYISIRFSLLVVADSRARSFILFQPQARGNVMHYSSATSSSGRSITTTIVQFTIYSLYLKLGKNSQAYVIKTFSNSFLKPPRRSVKNSTNSGPYCSNRAHLARSSAACWRETEEVPTVSIACASC